MTKLISYSETIEDKSTLRKNNIGSNGSSYILITGGAGFIGTNVADKYLSQGKRVMIFDNLSRAGVEENLNWLCSKYGDRVIVNISDIRDEEAVKKSVRHAERVFHFSAQVAVTKSLENPREDFEINVKGTLNLLEALRLQKKRTPLLFTSTNKVYGDLNDIKMIKANTRYVPEEMAVKKWGVNESRPLNFHSPYGCSKGSADQYIIDYSRVYEIPAVVFRMSCIYGPHQFGTEDQGWIAHFLIKAIHGEPILIYGDGLQVRDILYVGDLVEAMVLAHENIEQLSSKAFNIGGGTENTISLVELLDFIYELHGEKPEVDHHDWRQGDQKYYVSDTRVFVNATGWTPKINAKEGVKILDKWLLNSTKINQSKIKVKKVAQ